MCLRLGGTRTITSSVIAANPFDESLTGVSMKLHPRTKDLTGQQFNRLRVVSFAGYSDRKKAVWHCICRCGTTNQVSANYLQNGHTKSCGCLRRDGKTADLTGQTFSRWTVNSFAEYRDNDAYWNCHCECGESKPVKASSLISSASQSCGCLRDDLLRVRSMQSGTHRMSKSPEYKCWTKMKERCVNPNARSYPLYGGRGIKVCDRWMHSFQSFYDDLGIKPSPSHSIDRIDNNKGYDPGNCRWATPREQSRNKRNNLYVEYRGETKQLKEWCELLGLKYKMVWERLSYGWSVDRAFESPRRTENWRNQYD